MTTDLVNETDETIIIEPGESLRVKTETERKKSTVKRRDVHRIKEVGNE